MILLVHYTEIKKKQGWYSPKIRIFQKIKNVCVKDSNKVSCKVGPDTQLYERVRDRDRKEGETGEKEREK